ncbi:MAG: low molecular weight phosphotyrosine protein phosphatase [Sporichthyaceae bacterium]|nr:low molecular weight phosphotyrosine protein phosphatase [Sporichthyaceae bacterium]
MHICFVCTGNTCRSPIAALVFGAYLHRSGLADQVRVSSAGTGPLNPGEPLDPTATSVLALHGYPTEHTSATLRPDDLEADLLVAMAGGHRCVLHQLVSEPERRVRLLRSFDPAVDGDAEVPDPIYDGPGGYAQTLELIEAAMPGLLAWTQAQVAAANR